MDVDSAEKKKKKGKGKETSTTEKKKKWCGICKANTHDTDRCWNNPKSPNYRPKKEVKEKTKEGKEYKKKEKQPYKRGTIKLVESDSEDSTTEESEEEETPKASSSKVKINSAETKTAYIEDYEESDDELTKSPPSSDKRRGEKKLSRGKDFLRRHM
jgi:hypothetical protein